MTKKVIDLKRKPTEEPEDTAFLSWEKEEKPAREKSWQIGLIVLLIFCLVFVLWNKNYFGLILIVVIAFLIFYSPTKKKKYFSILKRGPQREREIFPWRNLKSFWIFENPPEIYFKSKKKNLPYHIIFPLPKSHIKRARKILSNFIPEKETEKNLFDILSEKLGL